MPMTSGREQRLLSTRSYISRRITYGTKANHQHHISAILALLILAPAMPASAQEATLNGFDEYVNKQQEV